MVTAGGKKLKKKRWQKIANYVHNYGYGVTADKINICVEGVVFVAGTKCALYSNLPMFG